MIEGLTEYLPVSSTGHLTVAERLLDLRGSAADAYAIVIQAGAILAVLLLYRRRIGSMVTGLLGRDDDGRTLLMRLTVAFVPAALLGLLLGDAIKDRLFGVGPVAAAWAVGGVVILVVAPRLRTGGAALTDLTAGRPPIVVDRPSRYGRCRAAVRSWPRGVGLSIAAAVESASLVWSHWPPRFGRSPRSEIVDPRLLSPRCLLVASGRGVRHPGMVGPERGSWPFSATIAWRGRVP